MGCGASQPMPWVQPPTQHNSYNGYGHDYTNYNYYHNEYGGAQNAQYSQDWMNYYNQHSNYQLSPSEVIIQNQGEQDEEDGYNQYMSWYQNRDIRPSCNKDYDAIDTSQQQNLPIDTPAKSAEEITAVLPEGENNSEDTNNMLAVTNVTKDAMEQKEKGRYDGKLKVTVIDTRRRPSASFLVNKPSGFEDKYVDESFDHETALGNYSQKYQWKRPHDIYPDAEIVLFKGGSTLDDIDQGTFGTCYLLSVLSGLAAIPQAIRMILPSDAYSPKKGLFHCRFWKFGQWYDIYTDDFLPCDNKGLVGCKSNNYKGEMWVPLLEKGYAKFKGSYPAAESGQPRISYIALTGGVGEWLPVHDKEHSNKDVLYNRIALALQHGSVVICSSHVEGDVAAYAQKNGLVLAHAYTVTATALVRYGNEKVKLVKLRNPWSYKEWNGPWSDKSKEWSKVTGLVQKKLRVIEDDGEFYMSWADHCKIFDNISICSYSPDYDRDGKTDGLENVFCIYGEWKGKTAAGRKSILNHPKYSFTIPNHWTSPVWVVAELIQQRRSNTPAKTTNLILHELESQNGKPVRVDTESKFSNADPLTMRWELEQNQTYVIVPCLWDQGDAGSYLIRIFSQDQLTVRSA